MRIESTGILKQSFRADLIELERGFCKLIQGPLNERPRLTCQPAIQQLSLLKGQQIRTRREARGINGPQIQLRLWFNLMQASA